MVLSCQSKEAVDTPHKLLQTRTTNTPAQAESLLHRLEGAADDIGLHVNADKTEIYVL